MSSILNAVFIKSLEYANKMQAVYSSFLEMKGSTMV